MKLYLVERREEIWYDEYKAMVIAATSPRRAKQIFLKRAKDGETRIGSEDNVVPVFIGFPKESIKEGIVLESFRAG